MLQVKLCTIQEIIHVLLSFGTAAPWQCLICPASYLFTYSKINWKCYSTLIHHSHNIHKDHIQHHSNISFFLIYYQYYRIHSFITPLAETHQLRSNRENV